ncbi:hypothetical protein [Bythopirellula polymerisocia]|uniref:Lipoprotein n=1 Tax=Bythopirellula polymerisocia TaxID=2528003 RepID=A0A5C6D0D7_9BACT|nr:hypothetical protein [Bythopirellula polymerisocia]TWU30178.1 hypothetical protein Pla144_09640 [Bythopirellula polymerisocia]
MKSSLCSALVSAFVAVTLLSSSSLAVEAEWIGSPTGNWSDPANWSAGVVPNTNTTDTLIDADSQQDSVVALDQNATIRNLIVNAGDALNLDSSRVLTANSVTVVGELNLATTSQLRVSQTVLIEPTATLTLADVGAQISRLGSAPFVQIWNQGRFEGAGGFLANEFRYAWINDGSVAANVPGKDLQIKLLGTNSRGVHFNQGELLAENGGTLRVTGSGNPFFTPLENNNGVVEARGDSTVRIGTIRLVGGRVFTSSVGGTNEGLVSMSSTILENVTIEGNIELGSVTFSDRVTNNTHVHSGGGGYFVEGYATISGNGSLDLNGGAFNIPGTNFGGIFVGTPGFVNDVNHTIRGPGKINLPGISTRLAFDNRGLLETAEGTLQINLLTTNSSAVTGSSINSGQMRAHSGGTIEILGANLKDTLMNSSGSLLGQVEAGVDSTVELGNMTLRGGILRSVAPTMGGLGQPGKVITSGTLSATLEDVRLEGKIGDTPTNSNWYLASAIENTGILTGRITITKPTILKGAGEIKLDPSGWIGGLQTSSGFYDPLINEDNLINGEGSLGNLAFVNRGIVQADVANRTLEISENAAPSSFPPQPVYNSGEMKAVNGGKLSLGAEIVNYEGSNLGTIHAGDGSEVTIAQVNGGILSTAGSGRIVLTPDSFTTQFLNSVHNQGLIQISTPFLVRGWVVNDGTIVQSVGTAYFGEPFLELTGNGVWQTGSTSPSIQIGQSPASFATTVFTNSASHTIQGGGRINVGPGSRFINRGILIANGNSTLTLSISQGAVMQQLGSLIVENAQTIEVQVNDDRFVNQGIMDVAGTFRLKRMDLDAIEFRNTAGAELHLNSIFEVSQQWSNSGSINIWNQAGALIEGHGNMNLYRPNTTQVTLFRNSGTLRPRGDENQTGKLTIAGNFQQDSTGVLEIELGGALDSNDFSALQVTNGQAVLGGSLDIALVNGFDPMVGDSFELFTNVGGNVLGSFDILHVPALPGRWWSLDYLTDKVLLNVNAITADFNLDGYVDGRDLSEWQTAYQAGTSAADADADGDSDGRDFLAWQQQFGSGIPPTNALAVPEPGSGLLLVGLLVCCPWYGHRCRKSR